MPLFKFDKNAFSALSMYPFDPEQEWANLGETQLDDMAEEAIACGDTEYQDNYAALMNFAGLIGVEDTSELLLVKVGTGGVFRDCYGPKVCRNAETDELCVKMGNSLIPATVNDGKIHCGDLSGKLSTSTKERQDKTEYLVGSVMFRHGQDKDAYSIPCSFDPEVEIDAATLDLYLDTGEDIAPYFRSSKSGGNKRLKDLEVGSYTVTEITVNDKGSVTLILEDGMKLYGTGNSESVGAKAASVCSESNPFVLTITEKDEYAQDKISVIHTLRRAGAMSRKDMKTKRMAEAVKKKVTAPKSVKVKTSETTKTLPKTAPTPVEEPDYEEIPF